MYFCYLDLNLFKVLGPLQKDETFVVDDFNLMEKLMQSGATDEINRVIDSFHADYTKTEGTT